MNPDELLRQRLDELREREWHDGVPSLARVLRDRPAARQSRLARMAVPALALAVLALVIWIWQPSVSRDDTHGTAGLALFEDETWTTPSDALLADNTTPASAPEGDAAIDGLTREINQMLKP